ncbi:glycoside hydrolase family 16 protein [Kitasatospora sp. NPDC050463]|uniref:glycoside hydrolase family 16 protein n=1 Tax=Kitasatospora sp. NPDC050463 TaxID=3155786 RepID=UPI0033C99434
MQHRRGHRTSRRCRGPARLGRLGGALLLAAAAGCTGHEVTAHSSTGPVRGVENALPAGIAGQWHLVFDDEFDGTALDTAKWSTGNPDPARPGRITEPVNDDELDCYDAGQVSVRDGALHITAVEREESCGGRTLPYVSGMVNSKGRFSYTFGAMEARLHLPAASPGVIANWPAFWSVGAQWPKGGENDVAEGLRGKLCSHFTSDVASTGRCTDDDFTGWHTFGAEWRPGRVDYYRDGVLAATIAEGVTSEPQWLMIDNAVQPAVGGPTVVPADLQVEYVRVWQS